MKITDLLDLYEMEEERRFYDRGMGEYKETTVEAPFISKEKVRMLGYLNSAVETAEELKELYEYYLSFAPEFEGRSNRRLKFNYKEYVFMLARGKSVIERYEKNKKEISMTKRFELITTYNDKLLGLENEFNDKEVCTLINTCSKHEVRMFIRDLDKVVREYDKRKNHNETRNPTRKTVSLKESFSERIIKMNGWIKEEVGFFQALVDFELFYKVKIDEEKKKHLKIIDEELILLIAQAQRKAGTIYLRLLGTPKIKYEVRLEANTRAKELFQLAVKNYEEYTTANSNNRRVKGFINDCYKQDDLRETWYQTRLRENRRKTAGVL